MSVLNEEWDIINTSKWTQFNCGNVLDGSIGISSSMLEVSMHASDTHPDTGYLGMRTIDKYSISRVYIEVSMTMGFMDYINDPVHEYSVDFVISDEIKTKLNPFSSDVCNAYSFTDALIIRREYLNTSYIADYFIVIRNGTVTTEYSQTVPYGSDGTVIWGIYWVSNDKIYVYRNDSLVYTSSDFNFKDISEAYFYNGMYSSTSKQRSVYFDYVRCTDVSAGGQGQYVLGQNYSKGVYMP